MDPLTPPTVTGKLVKYIVLNIGKEKLAIKSTTIEQTMMIMGIHLVKGVLQHKNSDMGYVEVQSKKVVD